MQRWEMLRVYVSEFEISNGSSVATYFADPRRDVIVKTLATVHITRFRTVDFGHQDASYRNIHGMRQLTPRGEGFGVALGPRKRW